MTVHEKVATLAAIDLTLRAEQAAALREVAQCVAEAAGVLLDACEDVAGELQHDRLLQAADASRAAFKRITSTLRAVAQSLEKK